MKRVFIIAFAAASLTACNNTTTSADSAVTDTMAAMPIVTDTEADIIYTPVEGDVVYRDNKVYVMKNGEWVVAEKDVTLGNGVVVYRTGTVKKDKKERGLKEGEVVTKTGDFFDKSGRAIANAWDDTKDAVEDAGEAVGKAAKKTGKKIDSVVTGKHE